MAFSKRWPPSSLVFNAHSVKNYTNCMYITAVEILIKAHPSTTYYQLMAATASSRQYISALSILAVAVLVGVPVWWKTTEVYRCPLPYHDIMQLASQPVSSLTLQCKMFTH